MKCFNHKETDSIGLCKACARALCVSCYVEVGHSLSCKGECEAKVKILNEMVERNMQILSTTNRKTKTAALAQLGLGILFLSLGCWQMLYGDSFLTIFLTGAGSMFFIFGILLLRKSMKLPVNETDNKEVDQGST